MLLWIEKASVAVDRDLPENSIDSNKGKKIIRFLRFSRDLTAPKVLETLVNSETHVDPNLRDQLPTEFITDLRRFLIEHCRGDEWEYITKHILLFRDEEAERIRNIVTSLEPVFGSIEKIWTSGTDMSDAANERGSYFIFTIDAEGHIKFNTMSVTYDRNTSVFPIFETIEYNRVDGTRDERTVRGIFYASGDYVYSIGKSRYESTLRLTKLRKYNRSRPQAEEPADYERLDFIGHRLDHDVESKMITSAPLYAYQVIRDERFTKASAKLKQKDFNERIFHYLDVRNPNHIRICAHLRLDPDEFDPERFKED